MGNRSKKERMEEQGLEEMVRPETELTPEEAEGASGGSFSWGSTPQVTASSPSTKLLSQQLLSTEKTLLP